MTQLILFFIAAVCALAAIVSAFLYFRTVRINIDLKKRLSESRERNTGLQKELYDCVLFNKNCSLENDKMRAIIDYQSKRITELIEKQ